MDLFLFYRTDYTDSRTMLNGCTGKCVRLSRPLIGFFERTLNHRTFIHSFHSNLVTLESANLYHFLISVINEE